MGRKLEEEQQKWKLVEPSQLVELPRAEDSASGAISGTGGNGSFSKGLNEGAGGGWRWRWRVRTLLIEGPPISAFGESGGATGGTGSFAKGSKLGAGGGGTGGGGEITSRDRGFLTLLYTSAPELTLRGIKCGVEFESSVAAVSSLHLCGR